MNYFAVSSILIVISNLFIGVFVAIKSKDRAVRVAWLFFCALVSSWGIGGYKLATAESYESAYFWKQITSISIIFIPISFSHFIHIFLEIKKKLLFLCLYLLGVLLLVQNLFWPKYFLGDIYKINGELYWTDWLAYKNTTYLLMYVGFYWILLIYTFFLLFIRFRQSVGIKKVQLRYFILGNILGWIGPHGCFISIFRIEIYPYTNFLIALYPLIIGYAIIRHKLMDIDVVIKKSLVYSIFVALITALYSIFIYLINQLSRDILNTNSWLINIAFIFFVAALFNPLRDWIQHILDKRLFHGTLESLERESQRLRQELFNAEKLAYVGQLASSVVHEVRNPLATIKTYLEYLPQKYQQPEFKAKFERLIPQEISRLEKIVNQLLGLARQRKLVLQKLDVTGLIYSTIDLLENNFKAKDIRIEKHYDAGANIEGDQEQLKQVFLNLFLNAIQAMEEGGVLTLNVSNKANAQANPFVEITIHDTGCGIPAEQLRQLFKPFQTTKEDGIGLGLSITREIIEQHNGTITVDSTVGQGTTFTITLPGANDGK